MLAGMMRTFCRGNESLMQRSARNFLRAMAMYVRFVTSLRDSAAFDIDRFPFTSPNQPLGPEDTDFFTQPGTVFDSQFHLIGNGLRDTNSIAIRNRAPSRACPRVINNSRLCC